MCVHLKWDHLVSDAMWKNVGVVCGVCLQWSPIQPNPTVTVHRPLNNSEKWRAQFRHTRVSSQWNACFSYLSIHKMVPPVWCHTFHTHFCLHASGLYIVQRRERHLVANSRDGEGPLCPSSALVVKAVPEWLCLWWPSIEIIDLIEPRFYPG